MLYNEMEIPYFSLDFIQSNIINVHGNHMSYYICILKHQQRMQLVVSLNLHKYMEPTSYLDFLFQDVDSSPHNIHFHYFQGMHL